MEGSDCGLYTEQGVQQVMQILKHLQTNASLGKYMVTALKSSQIVSRNLQLLILEILPKHNYMSQ